MQQVESIWKLAIKIDVTAIVVRTQQLNNFIKEAEELCKKLQDKNKPLWENTVRIIKKDNLKLISLLSRLNMMYQAPVSKRGLINAIGSISKTLFGTMDDEDAKTINEQIKMLQDRQQTAEHIAKNQLTVLQATIGRVKNLEQTINYNENLLANTTTRIQQQLGNIIQREEIEEYLLLINTILSDLTNDMQDIVDYLTYTRDGTILTHLLPVDNIIINLKEAAMHLSDGLHFPFRIQTRNWRTIQKYITVSA